MSSNLQPKTSKMSQYVRVPSDGDSGDYNIQKSKQTVMYSRFSAVYIALLLQTTQGISPVIESLQDPKLQWCGEIQTVQMIAKHKHIRGSQDNVFQILCTIFSKSSGELTIEITRISGGWILGNIHLKQDTQRILYTLR